MNGYWNFITVTHCPTMPPTGPGFETTRVLAARELQARHPGIDLLINNAGVMFPPTELSRNSPAIAALAYALVSQKAAVDSLRPAPMTEHASAGQRPAPGASGGSKRMESGGVGCSRALDRA